MLRIGRPPGGGQFDPNAPKKWRRGLLIAAAAGVFLGVGVAGAVFLGGMAGNRDQAAPPSQAPMPSSPSLKVLDERATCVLVVPVARDGAQEVLALTQKPDGSTVNWKKMQKAHDDLKLIAEVAAPELRDDINQQAATLSQLLSIGRTGGKMTFEFGDFKTSGVRIGARCDRYAS